MECSSNAGRLLQSGDRQDGGRSLQYVRLAYCELGHGLMSLARMPLCVVSGRMAPGQQLSLQGSYSYQHVAEPYRPLVQILWQSGSLYPSALGQYCLGVGESLVNVSLHGQGMSKRWANNEHYDGTEVDGYWDMGLTLYRQLDGSESLGKIPAGCEGQDGCEEPAGEAV